MQVLFTFSNDPRLANAFIEKWLNLNELNHHKIQDCYYMETTQNIYTRIKTETEKKTNKTKVYID